MDLIGQLDQTQPTAPAPQESALTSVSQQPEPSAPQQPAPQGPVVNSEPKDLDLSEAQKTAPPSNGNSVFSSSGGAGRKKLWVWAAAGLLIIGLASLGVYVYLTFFTTEPPPEKIAPTPLPNPAISMEKELDGIESDLNSLEADTNVEENLGLDFTL